MKLLKTTGLGIVSAYMAADDIGATSAAGEDPARRPPQARFAATRWTVVLTAARSDTTRGRDALAQLCQMYWYPLYAYVRRKGYSPPDAEDLTQAFFAQVLRERLVASRTGERTFPFVSADAPQPLPGRRMGPSQSAEARWWRTCAGAGDHGGRDALSARTVDWRSPDRLYEHRWALTLLERVFDRLQQEYRQDGKAALFEETKECLAQARAAVPYAEAGARLGLSEGALRVAVHRLRQRYRELLRAEVADTVSGPKEVEEELRYLFRVLAG